VTTQRQGSLIWHCISNLRMKILGNTSALSVTTQRQGNFNWPCTSKLCMKIFVITSAASRNIPPRSRRILDATQMHITTVSRTKSVPSVTMLHPERTSCKCTLVLCIKGHDITTECRVAILLSARFILKLFHILSCRCTQPLSLTTESSYLACSQCYH
jgi:hypothetical protein